MTATNILFWKNLIDTSHILPLIDPIYGACALDVNRMQKLKNIITMILMSFWHCFEICKGGAEVFLGVGSPRRDRTTCYTGERSHGADAKRALLRVYISTFFFFFLYSRNFRGFPLFKRKRVRSGEQFFLFWSQSAGFYQYRFQWVSINLCYQTDWFSTL